MAHELDMANGRANMAFVGEQPWHGLGQELTEDASIDTWKVEAGMNWNINSSPVRYNTGEITQDEYTGKTVLYRSDNKEPLSIVSDKYKVVQPDQVLEFFRDLTEDLGMKMNTAGCLFGGKKFWALADTGMAGKVLGNDDIKGFLLLTSSCDGTSPTIAQFTAVRVVCNNTLNVSLNQGSSNRASVRHRTVFSPEDIKSSLGLLHNSWDSFMDSVTDMSATKISVDKTRTYIEQIMAVKPEHIKEGNPALTRKVDEIMNLYRTGLGSEMANGTVWGAFNSITEFLDHHSGGRVADTQLWNSWYGVNSDLKVKAFNQAQELMAA